MGPSLALAALAGAPEEVERAVDRWPESPVVLSCAPASSVSDAIGMLPSAFEEGEVPTMLLDLAARGEAGFDPAGAVTLVRDPGSGLLALRMGFNGTNEQAGMLLGVLDPEMTGGEGRWELRFDERQHTAVLSDGTLELTTGAHPAGAAPDPDRMLADMPEVPGCAAFLADPQIDPSVEIASASVFLPLEGGAPAILRMRTADPLPASMAQSGARVPVGNSPIPPSTVVTLSSSTEAVLADLAAVEEGASSQDVLGDLQRVARMPEGASLAFLGDPEAGGDWIGMVRILNRKGKPFRPSRLVKLVDRRAKGVEIERLDRDAFAVLMGDQPVFVRAHEDGRVAFASTPDLVLGAFGPEGQPWLDAAGVARAEAAPVVLQTDEPELQAAVSMRPYGEAVEFAIELQPMEDGQPMQASIVPLMSLLLPVILATPHAATTPPQG